MPPNIVQETRNASEQLNINNEKPKIKFAWTNIIFLSYFHLAGIYGLYLIPSAKLLTVIFGILLYHVGGFGVVAGNHRCFAHGAFKTNWQLRLFLVYCSTISIQGSVINWVRDHRVHHKFIDTDADPYNAKRGFFFSHIGWLLVKKHPAVREKGKTVDLSDLYADPILRFQDKYYLIISLFVSIIIPTLVPIYLWNETLANAWFIAVVSRIVLGFNTTFTVNSLAHKWGSQPYNKKITAKNNYLVHVLTYGEGWHNYHHTFPMDYRGGEFTHFKYFISNTGAIDFFARMGWAYDRKVPSLSLVKQVSLKNLSKDQCITSKEL